jgi:putative ABC transport system substrate-binding protein
MKRRDLFALVAGMTTLRPLAARAQQKAMRVIAFLNSGSREQAGPLGIAFRQGLSENGYIEGENWTAEYRYADGDYDRLPALAADLVSRKVDVVVSIGGDASARAAKNATSTIPIVFSTGGDPVQAGLVASFARPGGNLTGFSIMAAELQAKRLELLSELVPDAGVIAMLVYGRANDISGAPLSGGAAQEAAARAKGLKLHIVKAGSESEIDAAFSTLVELKAGAVIVSPDALFNSRPRREQLVALASRYAIPAIYQWREFADEGGLISYGANLLVLWHRLGLYTGQILNGVKPADLPIQRPNKFELVINLKTAKALGLTVPQSLLARADEVIE